MKVTLKQKPPFAPIIMLPGEIVAITEKQVALCPTHNQQHTHSLRLTTRERERERERQREKEGERERERESFYLINDY